jgi:hypothetical protein
MLAYACMHTVLGTSFLVGIIQPAGVTLRSIYAACCASGLTAASLHRKGGGLTRRPFAILDGMHPTW